jgi:hypothetical protein
LFSPKAVAMAVTPNETHPIFRAFSTAASLRESEM